MKNKITKISPGVHDPNRVNIFIDDKFSFSFNLAQVVDYKLKVGKQLTDAELEKCKKASEFGKLYQRTLEWALARPRSVYETREYLKRKLKKREITNRRIAEARNEKHNAEYFGRTARKTSLPSKELPLFSEEDIEAVIARLTEHHYLDDEHFARFYLENRNAAKGSSVKKLRLDLLRKGISRKLIDELLSENLRSDAEEIQKIIAKKRRKYDDEQLISYLVRQGFDYQLSRDAVAETDSQNPL